MKISRSKSARLGSVMFVAIALLPFIGLMIMDYQLRDANDITGNAVAQAGEFSAGGYYAKAMSVVFIVGVLAFAIVGFVYGQVRDYSSRIPAKTISQSDPSIVSINNEIEKLTKQFKSM